MPAYTVSTVVIAHSASDTWSSPYTRPVLRAVAQASQTACFCGTAQHSTAQHSTAQPSWELRSPAYQTKYSSVNVSPNHCLSLERRSSALATCFVSTAVSSRRRRADFNIRLTSPRCSSELTRHTVKWERARSIVDTARAGACTGMPPSSASRADSEPSPKNFSALQQRFGRHGKAGGGIFEAGTHEA